MRGTANPALSLYTAGGQRKYLTPHERARFIASARACPRDALRTFCLVLAFTGCRISEALAITHAAIELDSGFIAIRSLKKRNGAVVVREIPIPTDLLNALDEVHQVSTATNPTQLWPWSRSRAWQLVKSIIKQAGVSAGIHATPKGLRHGFGIHAVRSGVPLNLVQRWLGHARMETTAIYLQALGDEEREIAHRMWN